MCVIYFTNQLRRLQDIRKNKNVLDGHTDGKTDNVKTVCPHKQRGTCIKRLFWPHYEAKNENCFLQVSSY